MTGEFCIGIDLGGTNLRIALLDAKYKIEDRESLSTRRFKNRRSLIAAIGKSVDNILARNRLKTKNILGVGIGLPGQVDFVRGIVHSLTNIRGWREVNLKRILQTKLRLPVFLDNDVKLMTLAEYTLGAARGAQNAVCLTLGTGVGGGIILEGRLYRGCSNAAGEIGHLPLNENGHRCNCGGFACLETYIGNNTILKKARKIFKEDISLEEVSRRARFRDHKAIEFWSDVGLHLGNALTGVVNILNPDVIVIGGGVANAGKVLFGQVKKVLSGRAMRVQASNVKIMPAKLGNDAGLIGAAIMVKAGVENR